MEKIKKLVVKTTFLFTITVSLFSQSSVYQREIFISNPRLYGSDIESLQNRLISIDFTEVGEVDGWYGPNSQSAIKSFQRSLGLNEDGIVTEYIWNLIFNPNITNVIDQFAYIAELENENSYSQINFDYQILSQNGPEYPIGYQVDAFSDDSHNLVKLKIRMVLDGSGYNFTIYFQDNSITSIRDRYWGFDESSQTIETRTEYLYLFDGDNLIAMKNMLENIFVLENDENHIERISRIKGIINEALIRLKKT